MSRQKRSFGHPCLYDTHLTHLHTKHTKIYKYIFTERYMTFFAMFFLSTAIYFLCWFAAWLKKNLKVLLSTTKIPLKEKKNHHREQAVISWGPPSTSCSFCMGGCYVTAQGVCIVLARCMLVYVHRAANLKAQSRQPQCPPLPPQTLYLSTHSTSTFRGISSNLLESLLSTLPDSPWLITVWLILGHLQPGLTRLTVKDDTRPPKLA